MIKEIQAGYLSSLYFKDIYLYLAHNRLPSKKAAMKRVELLAERYILLDFLLFKLTTTPGKETAMLAILEICVSYDGIALDLRSASTDRPVDESSSNLWYKKYTGSRVS